MAQSDSSGNPGVLMAEAPSAGKHYTVVVPDYGPTTGGTHAYVRMGAPHPNAGDAGQAALGEDLATSIASNQKGFHTAGGTRDHTDGNRVTTTRQTKIDVVGASYRRFVGQQNTRSNSDPNWNNPSGTPYDDDETPTTYHELIFTKQYYDLVATSAVPDVANNLTYAPKRKQTTDISNGDLYEYYNGVNVTEMYAGSASATSAVYSAKVTGIESTVYASHADWETNRDSGTSGWPSSLSSPVTPGSAFDTSSTSFDLKEIFIGSRVLEVARAESYLEERLVCDNGDFLIVLGANKSSGTFYEQVWGNKVNEQTYARDSISSSVWAGTGGIDETVWADGGIIHGSTKTPGAIHEEAWAGGDITDYTGAGGTIFEYTASATKFGIETIGLPVDITVSAAIAELKAAVITIFDLAASRYLISVDIGQKIEASLGPEKIEYHNGVKVEAGPTKAEINEALTEVADDVAYLMQEACEVNVSKQTIAATYEIL